MQIYLVGGAVRDRLLGRPVSERDYVVVGATPEEMRARGFRQVGREFPVFLHPRTGEEYALARTRRRPRAEAGPPVVHASPEVTLEQDLARRDLTINALAEDDAGRLVDPYGGLADLRARRLRHLSPDFAEDPVRILRVARFMARYRGLGFHVAAETLALMSALVAEGALDRVTPERVWKETERALGEPHPAAFVETLRACGALQRLFPELERLFGVPQPARWHPEIDTGVHTLLVVERARALSDDPAVVFAALTHDLGKGTTPADILPSHKGHEGRGAELVAGLCRRWRAPNRFRDLALAVARCHGLTHHAFELRPARVVDLFADLDAFRRPRRLEDFLLACEADYRGRYGFEERPYPQAEQVRLWFRAAATVDAGALARALPEPARIPGAVREARIAAVRRAPRLPVPDET